MKVRSERKLFFESGQALVLILLSLSVVLTIILFILSRSITDISTSTEQSDSVRAFSAAEAGVENALITGVGASGVAVGSATYSVDVSEYSKGTSVFNYPISLLSGDSMTLWFVSHDGDGNITCSDGNCFTGDTVRFCWGNSSTESNASTTPAIEIAVYYESTPGDPTSIKIARATIDPNPTRSASNSFSATDGTTCDIDGTSYAFQKTISLSSLGISSYGTSGGLLFARVRMIYNTNLGQSIGATVNFTGNSTLPSQGLGIISTGTSGTGEGASNRKVAVFKGWPEFPFYGMSVFSPYGLTK